MCLVLKKPFQEKENFLVGELQASTVKLPYPQGTVSVMGQCVSEENSF